MVKHAFEIKIQRERRNVRMLTTLNLPNTKFGDTIIWKPPYSLNEILVGGNQSGNQNSRREILRESFSSKKNCRVRIFSRTSVFPFVYLTSLKKREVERKWEYGKPFTFPINLIN